MRVRTRPACGRPDIPLSPFWGQDLSCTDLQGNPEQEGGLSQGGGDGGGEGH